MSRAPLFGTSGIRGYTNTEITVQLAVDIAQSFGSWLGSGKSVAVGRDTRFGAQALTHATLAGLAAAGINAVDCGCLPTPALATYTKENRLHGSIMITGSHMPPDRIGIIPMLGDGAYLPSELSDQVEEIYRGGKFKEAAASPHRIHPVKGAVSPIDTYKRSVLAIARKGDIAKRDFKVLADPGNGTGCGILHSLLNELGCHSIEINAEQKGDPDRSPEPRDGSISEARMLVKERNCDLGACLDLDSDRVVFIDESGETISEDIVGIIFADHIFEGGGGRFVTPINSSGIVDWFCRERGVDLTYCKVGQPETVKTIKELGADYSYEESGKYYFAREINWCDGILATLKMLEVMAATGKGLGELAAQYPEFHQVKEKLRVPDQLKDEVIQAAAEAIVNIPGDPILIRKDGLKLMFHDDSWLLIRASGTEPIIRVFSDSRSLETAKELVSNGKWIIQDIIERLERH